MNKQNLAFRNYVTRVSFSLNLTRHQLFVLGCVVKDIERENYFMGLPNVHTEQLKKLREDGEHVVDTFIPGVSQLISRGFVIHTDPINMPKKWSKYPYSLTEAGEHLVALLRIAGLIEQRVQKAKAS